jgi:hypothetical protein
MQSSQTARRSIDRHPTSPESARMTPRDRNQMGPHRGGRQAPRRGPTAPKPPGRESVRPRQDLTTGRPSSWGSKTAPPGRTPREPRAREPDPGAREPEPQARGRERQGQGREPQAQGREPQGRARERQGREPAPRAREPAPEREREPEPRAPERAPQGPELRWAREPAPRAPVRATAPRRVSAAQVAERAPREPRRGGTCRRWRGPLRGVPTRGSGTPCLSTVVASPSESPASSHPDVPDVLRRFYPDPRTLREGETKVRQVSRNLRTFCLPSTQPVTPIYARPA